jgi:hypothetical protein
MDAPEGRKNHTLEEGNVVVLSHVGGLHRRYERKAA